MERRLSIISRMYFDIIWYVVLQFFFQFWKNSVWSGIVISRLELIAIYWILKWIELKIYWINSFTFYCFGQHWIFFPYLLKIFTHTFSSSSYDKPWLINKTSLAYAARLVIKACVYILWLVVTTRIWNSGGWNLSINWRSTDNPYIHSIQLHSLRLLVDKYTLSKDVQ